LGRTEGRFARILRFVDEQSPLELALRLTLLDLLLQPIGAGWVRPAVLLLAAGGLLTRPVLRSPWLWLGLTLLTGARVLMDWPHADNHAYLLAYWCLAASLALASPRPEVFLAHNGRWLIALVFTFALFWKLTSPDFVDGTFFRVMLVTDVRFDGLSRLAGMTPAALEELGAALRQHADGPTQTLPIPAQPAVLRLLGLAATGWTLLSEGLVAGLFLWPSGRGPSRARDAALLIFCATTYAAATVEGFGWLLLAMGMAQCSPERGRTRLVYVAVYALILVYRELPPFDWLGGRLGPV
jgi:hypothetical protein